MDGPEGPMIGVAPWIDGCRMSFRLLLGSEMP